ncbi:MAG: sulfatase-like hydrolase/transferase [Kiritimatiellales bacterium]|nr:sulfatase-like hydrolase/transferase [Kiritimatiellales bacterium]
MKLKILIRVLLAFGALVGVGQAAQKPNVVLIIADDHRADWMGHKGNPFMATPNLDRLAAEGISFENAFACSGVCSPSRASILTGRYAHRASAPEIIWCNNSFLMTQQTFPQFLKQAGYRTGYIGKLHLGEDEKPKPGFDEWIGFPFVGNFHDQPLWINGKNTESKGFTDDRLAELAAAQIKKWSGAGDDPFCLVVGLKASHIPFQYPERMKSRLVDTVFSKPATWELRKPGLKGNCIFADQFQPGIPSYGSFQEWLRSYSRLALTLDESVGTIVQALEKSGRLDNTLVIYTSDQGYSLGEFGLCEKHYAYEQVMRVPMIVRYPKVVSPGMKREQMVLNLDIAPTILDLCGVPAPDGMDGKSWAPLFAETNATWRDEFLFDFWNAWSDALPPMQAVRTDRYKLIDYLAKPVKELYDLKNDPLEQRDLYDHPEYAAVQQEMEARLEKLKHDTGFQPREVKLLQSCWVLGPVAAAEETALRKQLVGGDIPANARRLHQPFDLSPLKLSSGDVFYLVVAIDRLTGYDPYVTLEFFAAGGFRQWSKQHIPMAAFYGDEMIWMNKPYATAEGLAYAPIGKFNDPCNYPLMGEKNLAVFRCIVPQQLPKLQSEIIAPDGAIQTDQSK